MQPGKAFNSIVIVTKTIQRERWKMELIIDLRMARSCACYLACTVKATECQTYVSFRNMVELFSKEMGNLILRITCSSLKT